MATERSYSYLSGEGENQDLLDLLYTLQPAAAHGVLTAAATTVIGTSSVYKVIGGTATTTVVNNVTVSSVLKYTNSGTATKYFTGMLYLDCQNASSTSSTITAAITKDGTAITNATGTISLTTTTAGRVTVFMPPTSVAADSYIQPMIKSSKAVNVTVNQVHFLAFSLPLAA